MLAASRSLGRTPPARPARDSLSTRGFKLGVGGMLWPVPGSKTTGGTGWRVHPVYGYRSCHTGIDIAGTWGTPILAALAGKVVAVAYQKAYGLRTTVDDGTGISTSYSHQQKSHVKVGQTVSRGEVIGEVGSTGWVTGPHLHFEVHRKGIPQDPLGWFLPNHRRVPVACLAGSG
jgi:murein DD-endopeptidase MepM/ murein hydrolase activator NlpD